MRNQLTLFIIILYSFSESLQHFSKLPPMFKHKHFAQNLEGYEQMFGHFFSTG